MKVILQEDVKKLGKKGEVIEVKEGYARNFLLPRNLAVEANTQNVKEQQRQENLKKGKEEKRRLEAEKVAEKISNVKLELKVKSGEKGKLFGAITTKDIAEKLAQEHKITIDKRKIDLEDNIKNLGVYDVKIKLHPQVTVELNVKVSAE